MKTKNIRLKLFLFFLVKSIIGIILGAIIFFAASSFVLGTGTDLRSAFDAKYRHEQKQESFAEYTRQRQKEAYDAWKERSTWRDDFPEE